MLCVHVGTNACLLEVNSLFFYIVTGIVLWLAVVSASSSSKDHSVFGTYCFLRAHCKYVKRDSCLYVCFVY